MSVATLSRKLHEANIPIVGVSDNGDGTYRIDFAEDATPEQQDEAAAVVAAFDPAAEEVAEQQAGVERRGVVEALEAELDWLGATIPGIDGMAAGEVRSLAKRLAAQNLGIIKVLAFMARRIN